MSERQIQVVIDDQSSLRARMRYVWDMVNKAITAGAVLVTLSRPSKTRLQEAHYHALIGDIAKQVNVGGRTYDVDTWKALLVDSFEQELLVSGTPLTHPGKTVISLDGRRAVTIRPSTTKFRKAEASEFIEFLYAFGVEHGVQFGQKALEIYQSYREAAQGADSAPLPANNTDKVPA